MHRSVINASVRVCRVGFVSLLALGWILSATFARSVDALTLNHDDNSGDYVNDEVVAGFSSDLSNEQKEEILSTLQAEIIGNIPEINAIILRIPAGTVESAAAYLNDQPFVLFAEPNYLLSALDTYPSDPSFSLQYGLTNIHAPRGWDFSTGAGWVTIAIVDSGVDYLHPDLSGKVLPGVDFVNGDSDAMDDNGHGTHVAGIAAAATNNGMGISGTSWGANLLPVKVLNSGGNGTYVNVANGIIWATDHGAQVINLSLGGSAPSTILEDAVNYAYTHGVVLVGSTGNTGGSLVLYPAHYAPVIAVAATDAGNNRAGFSNFGNQVDLAAPGDQIYSLFPGGGYGNRSGTSMSAPFVSGLAAILIGLPGNYNAGWVENQMESTALDLGAPGWDPYYGFGLIQMDVAIQLAFPTPTFTPTITDTPTYTLTPTSTHTSAPAFTNTPVLVNTRTMVTTPTSPAFPIFPNPNRTATLTSTQFTPQTPSLPSLPGTETISASPSPPTAGTVSENGILAAETPSSNSMMPTRNPDYLCAGSLCIGLGILLLILLREINKRSGSPRR